MRNDPECSSPSPRSRGCVLSLPLAHISHASRGSTYREAIGNLIAQAREQLILVAPFIDSAGISGLLRSWHRGGREHRDPLFSQAVEDVMSLESGDGP